MTPDRLRAALDSFPGRRVVVVGDLMLDEYIWGDVSRISPDAPVQVVEVRRRTHAIGGAGNVAHNVAAAGGRPVLIGVVGDDEAGALLRERVARAGIDPSGVLVDRVRPTTRKTRVVARGQHVLRLDEEVASPLSEAVLAAVAAAVDRAIGQADALVVSDYAKGVVDRRLVASIVDAVRRSRPGLPIVVDPKSVDLGLYAGCTMITPNAKEAEAATRVRIGDEDTLREASRRIREACGAAWVLVTLGERGLALAGPDGTLETVPARAREVYDVTGAGDTVVAYVGLGLAAGLSAFDAAVVANAAAAAAVAKVGAVAVSPSDVLESAAASDSIASKALPLEAAIARVEHARSIGRRVVFTNGCFDLLHAGHVHLLERARRLGDLLIVAVNSDASVRRLKGAGRPVVVEEDRVKILAALDAVDLVLLFDEDTPLGLIECLRPDVLVKGGDYTKNLIVGADLVESWGGRVETVPLVSGRSTTSILSSLRRDDE